MIVLNQTLCYEFPNLFRKQKLVIFSILVANLCLNSYPLYTLKIFLSIEKRVRLQNQDWFIFLSRLIEMRIYSDFSVEMLLLEAIRTWLIRFSKKIWNKTKLNEKQLCRRSIVKDFIFRSLSSFVNQDVFRFSLCFNFCIINFMHGACTIFVY